MTGIRKQKLTKEKEMERSAKIDAELILSGVGNHNKRSASALIDRGFSWWYYTFFEDRNYSFRVANAIAKINLSKIPTFPFEHDWDINKNIWYCLKRELPYSFKQITIGGIEMGIYMSS